MNGLFYIYENGQQMGPFTIEDLKSKNIHRETLVWTEGLPNWTKAENVEVLKGILKATPPPPPNLGTHVFSTNVPPPPTGLPNESNYFGYQLATKGQRFWAWFLQTLIFLSIYVILRINYTTDVSTSDSSQNNFFSNLIIAGISNAVFGAIFYSLWGFIVYGEETSGIK